MGKREKQALIEAGFSKYQLIKINMTYVYKNPEVKKEIQKQLLQLQMKLVLGDYVKIAIWWGRFFWCGK